ncbi:hypothetical protein [Paraburkholderia haematera]|uniref:Uncharacterized protein n=1 Tax=Paraburkholderia haematera TaxID=2793077 RepID=A0ABM8QHA3_9BURK|nr:hypothetical protein [Paraburkholderia haematera]CAE6696637.1 hypothetical protein R69888_00500 [Paraburkholderia haematera]
MMGGLWVLTFFIGILSDVMSGAIRYYTSLAGAPQAIYLPKVMMAACIVLIVSHRPKVSHLLVLLYLAMQACVSLFNGVGPGAVAFWAWTVLPMFFALLAPPEALAILGRPRARNALLAVAAVCMLGVLASYAGYFTPLPWVGASTVVDGTAVHVTSSTFVGDTPRLPGFGRDSAATGLMLGLLSTWLLPRFRSLTLASMILAVAALSIWATTNKTALVALAIVLGIERFGKLDTIRRAAIWAAAAVLLLPLASFAITAAINHSMIAGGALSSFRDRFENTWPLLLQGLLRENMIWLGIGPGGFGAATTYYHTNFGFNVGYADNVALYVIANFGVLGVAIFATLLSRLFFVSESKDRFAWTMLLFLLISGITTDIFESLGCLLFLGAAAKSLWLNAEGQRFRLNPGLVMSVRGRKSTL